VDAASRLADRVSSLVREGFKRADASASPADAPFRKVAEPPWLAHSAPGDADAVAFPTGVSAARAFEGTPLVGSAAGRGEEPPSRGQHVPFARGRASVVRRFPDILAPRSAKRIRSPGGERGRPPGRVRRHREESTDPAVDFSKIRDPSSDLPVKGAGKPGVVPGQASSIRNQNGNRKKETIMANTKSNLAAQVRQFLTGARKHFPNGSQTLQIGGVTSTVTGLTAILQSFVDNRDAVEASKAATTAKLQAEQAQAPAQLAVFRAFEAVVRGTFGPSADVLADFGFEPPKARATRTAEEKAVSAAKSAATRVARGTRGKNQKKSIKGSIEAKLVVTSVTTSPVSPPVAAPAPATSAAAPPPHTA
jgi:hypothetical protein